MSLVLRRTLHFIVKVEQVDPERHRSAIRIEERQCNPRGFQQPFHYCRITGYPESDPDQEKSGSMSRASSRTRARSPI